jgi:hypothetical protein
METESEQHTLGGIKSVDISKGAGDILRNQDPHPGLPLVEVLVFKAVPKYRRNWLRVRLRRDHPHTLAGLYRHSLWGSGRKATLGVFPAMAGPKRRRSSQRTPCMYSS